MLKYGYTIEEESMPWIKHNWVKKSAVVLWLCGPGCQSNRCRCQEQGNRHLHRFWIGVVAVLDDRYVAGNDFRTTERRRGRLYTIAKKLKLLPIMKKKMQNWLGDSFLY